MSKPLEIIKELQLYFPDCRIQVDDNVIRVLRGNVILTFKNGKSSLDYGTLEYYYQHGQLDKILKEL